MKDHWGEVARPCDARNLDLLPPFDGKRLVASDIYTARRILYEKIDGRWVIVGYNAAQAHRKASRRFLRREGPDLCRAVHHPGRRVRHAPTYQSRYEDLHKRTLRRHGLPVGVTQ